MTRALSLEVPHYLGDFDAAAASAVLHDCIQPENSAARVGAFMDGQPGELREAMIQQWMRRRERPAYSFFSEPQGTILGLIAINEQQPLQVSGEAVDEMIAFQHGSGLGLIGWLGATTWIMDEYYKPYYDAVEHIVEDHLDAFPDHSGSGLLLGFAEAYLIANNQVRLDRLDASLGQ